jgi:hypothetical protein
LTEDGHPVKAIYLSNLALSLGDRFSGLGELADLEHTISYSRRAVELKTDNGHPDKAKRLSNLAVGLGDRFKYLGDRQTLWLLS